MFLLEKFVHRTFCSLQTRGANFVKIIFLKFFRFRTETSYYQKSFNVILISFKPLDDFLRTHVPICKHSYHRDP